MYYDTKQQLQICTTFSYEMFKTFELSKVKLNCPRKLIPFLFLLGFSFTDTDNSQKSRGRGRTIFYSTLTIPPAHKHLGIYLQLYMWDDYHIFLIVLLVFSGCYSMSFTNLSNRHFIDWWCDIIFCLFTWWFDTRFLLHRLSPLYYKRTDYPSVLIKCLRIFLLMLVFVNNILFHLMSTYFSTFYISIGNAVIVRVSFILRNVSLIR